MQASYLPNEDRLFSLDIDNHELQDDIPASRALVKEGRVWFQKLAEPAQLRLLTISVAAKEILNIDKSECGGNFDRTATFESLFSISDGERARLFALRSDEVIPIALRTLSLDPNVYDINFSAQNWEGSNVISIILRASIFGLLEARAFCNATKSDISLVSRLENPRVFESLRLIYATKPEYPPFLCMKEAENKTIGQLIAEGKYPQCPIAPYLRSMMGFPTSEEDKIMLKRWRQGSDGSWYLEADGIHLSRVSFLPNTFVVVSFWRIWCESSSMSSVCQSCELPGCSLWDVDPEQAASLEIHSIPFRTVYRNAAGLRWCGMADAVGLAMQVVAPYLYTSQLPRMMLDSLLHGTRYELREQRIYAEANTNLRDTIFNIVIFRVSRSSVFVAWRDVTEKVRLRVFNKQMRLLLDRTPTVCILATEFYRIISMNAKGRMLAGLKEEDQVRSRPVCQFLPDLESDIDKQRKENPGGEVQFEIETRFCSVGGESIPVVVSVVQFEEEAGFNNEGGAIMEKYVGLFGRELGAEIEARMKLTSEKQLAEAAASAKSDFLATMSHEIRTPLHGIIGCVELLQSSISDPTVKQLATNIENCTETLLTTVNDILDFSKIESRKIELDIRPIMVCDVLDSCVAVVSSELRRKHQNLRYSICANSTREILADFSRTRQIVLNLLGNAVKYTPEGKTIQVGVCVCLYEAHRANTVGCIYNSIFNECRTAEFEGGAFRILNFKTYRDHSHLFRCFVKDPGRGMSAEQVAKIFEPFVQARSVGSGAGHGLHGSETGTGLGLSIVRKLVEMLQGCCLVRSVLGKGSIFTACFPANVPEKTTPLEFKTDVAVVVCDTSDRECLVSLLYQVGARVSVFDSFEDLLAPAKVRVVSHYDSVIIDVDCYNSCNFRSVVSSIEKMISEPCPAQQPLPRICVLLGYEEKTNQMAADLAKQHEKVVLLHKPVTCMCLREILQPIDNRKRRGIPSTSTVLNDEPFNVLIVEDNSTNRFVLSQMLKNLGIKDENVKMARDGVEALEAVEKYSFDVILMDIHMPRMSGWEAARILRQSGSERFKPFGQMIALTAASTLSDREESLKYMDSFITKPLQMDHLVEVLNNSCERMGKSLRFSRPRRNSAAGEELMLPPSTPQSPKSPEERATIAPVSPLRVATPTRSSCEVKALEFLGPFLAVVLALCYWLHSSSSSQV